MVFQLRCWGKISTLLPIRSRKPFSSAGPIAFTGFVRLQLVGNRMSLKSALILSLQRTKGTQMGQKTGAENSRYLAPSPPTIARWLASDLFGRSAAYDDPEALNIGVSFGVAPDVVCMNLICIMVVYSITVCWYSQNSICLARYEIIDMRTTKWLAAFFNLLYSAIPVWNTFSAVVAMESWW